MYIAKYLYIFIKYIYVYKSIYLSKYIYMAGSKNSEYLLRPESIPRMKKQWK